ncbi:zeatin O-glucosyltransferase-like [Rutidosis leptorrhynchoides]|uniref:zeatin O-glucosyltransferase-like n=1 Tax=Rutidosis leptorrhynchoides TaxID=125765 RepID=UPI003A998BB7
MEDNHLPLPAPAADVVVVMVPFIAHGHLNQLFHLSRLISTYNIPVHFINTATHSRQLRSRHHDSVHPSVIFHEFKTPLFNSPKPDPSKWFPTHLQPAFESTLHLRTPVADLVRSLSKTARRVVVVHDFLMSYVVQDVKDMSNVETYIFNPLSACDSFWRTWERLGRPFEVDQELLNRLPSENGTFSKEFLDFVCIQYQHVGFHVGEIFDSSRAIEGEYIGYFEREDMKEDKKIWAIGPFSQTGKKTVTVSENRHSILRWLDLQPPNSVIYVSFGTTTSFSDEQIKELALGLERSEQRFIWVARSADIGDVFEDEAKIADLPNGFEARVKERGLVVRGWAPQLEILGHVATGGFMSHCGWNSSIESISMGVPMATWPMHSDQPRNAGLIVHDLRIGLVVNDWEHRDKLVLSAVVEDVVRRLIGSEEGAEMRKRAAKLAENVRRSVAKGGESHKETESFISYISRN